MKDWKNLLSKVPEIAENFMGQWKKYDTPRNQMYLAYGRKTLEQVLYHYFLLRDDRIHPKTIKRILERALEINKEDIDSSIIKALNEWYQDKDDWEHNWNHSSYIANIYWCLENSSIWGYQIEIPKKPTGRPKKEYPIEEIKKLKIQGYSIREITKRTNTPKSIVQRILKQ